MIELDSDEFSHSLISYSRSVCVSDLVHLLTLTHDSKLCALAHSLTHADPKQVPRVPAPPQGYVLVPFLPTQPYQPVPLSPISTPPHCSRATAPVPFNLTVKQAFVKHLQLSCV